MEHADVVLVDVQVVQVVELLQHEMAGIEQDAAARVPGYALVEHLEADAVVQVFAGMDFEAQIHVLLVAGIQHRQPAPRQFVERGLDQSLRPLRKREQVGPGEGAENVPISVRPSRRDARAASNRLRLAHSVRAAGLPRTGAGAKVSNIAS